MVVFTEIILFSVIYYLLKAQEIVSDQGGNMMYQIGKKRQQKNILVKPPGSINFQAVLLCSGKGDGKNV